MKRPRIRKALYRVKEKLWWFDVIYPVTLILFLFGSLTYIIYAGQPQSRLSKIAEKGLLTNSTTLSGSEPVKNSGKILVVSVSPFEISKFGRAPGGTVPDVNAGAYAKIIRKLTSSGIKNVFVNWDTEAHLFDDIYMLPIIETLKQKAVDSKVLFGVYPEHMSSMPAEFTKIAVMLDSGPCDEITEVQIECVYNRTWDDWIVQGILNVLGEDKREASSTPAWISNELSSNFPRYILNLTDPGNLAALTFSEVLSSDPASLRSYDAVFVGVDYTNVLSPASIHSFPLMVRTTFNNDSVDARYNGTPMHIFWAQIAQMYIDHSMINVPSARIIWATTIGFSLLILVVMFYFGGLHALGMFIVFALAGPFVNAWSIKTLHVYVPMFDSYYFGVTILISVGMLRLSYASYRRWQLETRSHYHSKIMDLKSNFISLFSHNLNTPVAKMQGMLSILKNNLNDQPAEARKLAQEADTYVGLLEYAIRGVLVSSAIEEHSLNDTSRPLKNLFREVVEGNAPSLRRLGVNISARFLHEADELAVTPFLFDVRCLSATCSSLAALFRNPDHAVALAITMSAREDESGQSLTLTFQSPDGRLSEQAEEIIRNPDKQLTMKRLRSDRFIDEILAGLGNLMMRHYRGTIALHPEQDSGYVLIFTILCPAL